MIRKVFSFLKKAVCVILDVICFCVEFIVNGIKRLVSTIVGLIKKWWKKRQVIKSLSFILALAQKYNLTLRDYTSMKFKRSEMCLAVFYELIKGNKLTIKEVQTKLSCSRNTVYLVLLDIELFIADFFCYELEIVKEGKYIYLKK